MGTGSGHFGPGVRQKVETIFAKLDHHVPLDGPVDEVTVIEYGALHSRSAALIPDILDRFLRRRPSLAFRVIHADGPQTDFRPIAAQLESSSDSYVNHPTCADCVFPSFASRPFTARLCPPKSVAVGFSLLDLHWSQSGTVPAHVQMTSFLQARAVEFRQGGLLVLAYVQRPDAPPCLSYAGPPSSGGLVNSAQLSRARSGSSPGRTQSTFPRHRPDFWSLLESALAPCVQRLVSCGMVRPDVAPYLLSVRLRPTGFWWPSLTIAPRSCPFDRLRPDRRDPS